MIEWLPWLTGEFAGPTVARRALTVWLTPIEVTSTDFSRADVARWDSDEAEGARLVRVRYEPLVKGLSPSENGGGSPQLAESA